jgi:RHH-type rel operon transcriptional repressor/antitoxin RelB
MDSILTVRLDSEVKERASSVLREKGLTPSGAVQQFFDYVLRTGDLPFKADERPGSDEIARRLALFSRFQLNEPLQMTDEELRAARIRERHGIDA